jgi:hypothetical protein
VSFGLGSVIITALLLVVLTWHDGAQPPLHWDVLKTAGVLGGLSWSGGNVFILAAIVINGNAVGVPQAVASQVFFSVRCSFLGPKVLLSNVSKMAPVPSDAPSDFHRKFCPNAEGLTGMVVEM